MKTPEPLYPCAGPLCCSGFPSESILWSGKHQKWFCYRCWNDNHEQSEGFGISLAEHLKQTVAVVPRELDREQARAVLKAERKDGFMGIEAIRSIYRKAIETVEIKEKR